jgi:hypothetical protein
MQEDHDVKRLAGVQPCLSVAAAVLLTVGALTLGPQQALAASAIVGATLRGVSCQAETLCKAVGLAGTIRSWNGSGRRVTETEAHQEPAITVSSSSMPSTAVPADLRCEPAPGSYRPGSRHRRWSGRQPPRLARRRRMMPQ